MSMEYIWLILLVVFVITEAVSVGLTSIWLAVGALFGLLLALLNQSVTVQILAFLLVSIVALILLRPLASRYLLRKTTPTNVDALINRTVLVTADIDNLAGHGTVQVDGLPWSARAQDGQPIAAGTLVRILRVEGVKAYVQPV